MIIYSLICNHSGMRRVTESLYATFDILPPDFPLSLVIFSTEKPDRQDSRIHWLKINDFNYKNFSDQIQLHRKTIHELFSQVKIKWIIGESFSFGAFADIKAKRCYDVHVLARSYFKAASCHLSLDLKAISDHKSFIRHESSVMKISDRFIVNSIGSQKDLIDLYPDISEGKAIEYIPLSVSKVAPPSIMPNGRGLYYFGRWHPQKGINFLLKNDWLDLPITARGFDKNQLTSEVVMGLKSKGIEPLSWTDDENVLKEELEKSEAVLFPSIYEPWGLSLQEALSKGKICIAHTCHSGHEEQITHNSNGFLIDFADQNLKLKIKEILSLPDEIKREIKINASKMAQSGHQDRIQNLKNFLIDLKGN